MTEKTASLPPENGHRVFELQYCPRCDRYIFYPREACPYCLAVKPEWKEACGQGTIYSYTVVRRSYLKAFEDRIPYIYAIVELREGVRIPTNIVGCPVDEVKIGMPVELAWRKDGEKWRPVFRPVP